MKKIYRVTSNKDFANAVHKGVARRNQSFVIHVIANDLNYTRVGISVSKKLGVAVVRNRLKRQVRAMCGEIIDFNKHGIDIIIVVKDKFLNNEFHVNQDSLKSLITSITERN